MQSQRRTWPSSRRSSNSGFSLATRAARAFRAMQGASDVDQVPGDHESRGAFVRPSAPLVTQPLLGAQNQDADVIGEPLARELSQVALERS
jgi:hypothetical protein